MCIKVLPPLSNCSHFASSHRLPPRRTQAIPACSSKIKVERGRFYWNKSCEGFELTMGENWVETWKGIRFVSNKRPEVGRPTIWFGKSQIVSSSILRWSCSLVCNWYQTNLKSIIWVLKKCKKCIFRGLKVILVFSFPDPDKKFEHHKLWNITIIVTSPTSILDIVLFWRTQQRIHSLLNFFSLSKLLLLSSWNIKHV